MTKKKIYNVFIGSFVAQLEFSLKVFAVVLGTSVLHISFHYTAPQGIKISDVAFSQSKRTG